MSDGLAVHLHLGGTFCFLHAFELADYLVLVRRRCAHITQWAGKMEEIKRNITILKYLERLPMGI